MSGTAAAGQAAVRLEDLAPGTRVGGVLPDRAVTVVQAEWHGTQALTLTYRDDAGRVDHQLLYRDSEARLEIEETGRAWAFDADGSLFRLVSEALRIRLAYLFDPYLAVHTSNLEPLPHQIQAVYQELLPRQPLRFLLADDPGAGKTIMAGLFIKELIVRGDVKRCLVVAPGSLVEQWQDELWQKLGLDFEIITKQTIEASRSGNPFAEKHLVISRLDHLSRNEELQAKLEQTDWDLVVVDEAHKMSAHFFGNELKETKRYRLGRLLGSVTRHLLLMTATADRAAATGALVAARPTRARTGRLRVRVQLARRERCPTFIPGGARRIPGPMRVLTEPSGTTLECRERARDALEPPRPAAQTDRADADTTLPVRALQSVGGTGLPTPLVAMSEGGRF